MLSDEFDGWAATNHVQVETMPVRRALNVVWHYLTRNGDSKSIERLRLDLIRPLPGMSESVSDEVVSAELSMFKAALAKKA